MARTFVAACIGNTPSGADTAPYPTNAAPAERFAQAAGAARLILHGTGEARDVVLDEEGVEDRDRERAEQRTGQNPLVPNERRNILF